MASTKEERAKFWEQQAAKYGSGELTGWKDHQLLPWERDWVTQRVLGIIEATRKGQPVSDQPLLQILDICCANGLSTVYYMSKFPDCELTGVDNCEAMLDLARREQGAKQLKNGAFLLRDVTNDLLDRHYDVVICTRALINLGSWEEQQRGIANIAQALKPGGTLLLQEYEVNGQKILDQQRSEIGLPPVPVVEANHYLDYNALMTAMMRCELIGSMEPWNAGNAYLLWKYLFREMLVPGDMPMPLIDEIMMDLAGAIGTSVRFHSLRYVRGPLVHGAFVKCPKELVQGA